jgi:hypothetical protein
LVQDFSVRSHDMDCSEKKKKRVHYIAMGGEYGCMPDNCSTYRSRADAIEGLDSIYELTSEQKDELKVSNTVRLTREQGGAYCEVSECSCSSPWEHEEFGCEEDWEDYTDDDEDEVMPPFLKMDGMEDACIGVATKQYRQLGIAYSKTKILEILTKEAEKAGMTLDEAEQSAVEYFEFNIEGAWVGEGTPVIIDDTLDIDTVLNGTS